MTEFSTEPSNGNPIVHTWPYVFDVLNLVDHSVRVNDESGFCYWYSHTWQGFIGDGENGSTKNEITTRGRAFAHYPKFANETWRLGVTRTANAADFTYNTGNTTYTSNGQVQTDMSMKISAFEDVNEEFISVVMYSPIPRTGTGGPGDIGEIKIELPDHFTATSAYAMKSFGAAPEEYWLGDLVVLAADGKSAVVTLPAATIISVKFVK